MAFTDPMFQLGMRMTMTKCSYAEFSETVQRVSNMMKDNKSIHYALGYMMQSYIFLADRTNSIDKEMEHLKLLEENLLGMQNSMPTLQKSA
jgi:hypothetical protein